MGEKTMKIRLLAPDSKLVNLAILKLAQFHINKNDDVAWYEHMFDYNDTEILYISKIFTFTADVVYLPINAVIYRGGTGYDLTTKLPDNIENIIDIQDAYSLLYPDVDYSILFTTRGCVRKCSFCVVPQKEGLTHSIPMTSLNPNGKYIELLDNNFFSSSDWKYRLEQLKLLDQPINFNTGIDIRTLSELQAEALGKSNIKAIHIAWDNLGEEEKVFRGVDKLIKYVSPSKITCYVLVGFEQKEIIESDIYRVMKLHSYKITPFGMGYINFNDPKQKRTQSVKDFQRWVNRHIFKTVLFKEYNKK